MPEHNLSRPIGLQWFIGFTEGDGSFIKSKNRLFFVLTQKEITPLHYVRALLGFGKVSTYNEVGRYIFLINVKKDLIYGLMALLKLPQKNLRYLL
ncbi:putative intron-encoded endonuclease aI5 [Smittium culicis]|uniref:Putative intron-encoded endonuclease aI5 n=1 Tax=Smittium culicis TaxID=133412 RepID=A0A1R1WXE0_9FUNG|nr:putative intron-encoded endonuclease aI5 [Smittium culicis]